MSNRAVSRIGTGAAAVALAVLPATGASAVAPERFAIDETFEIDGDCDGTPAHIFGTDQGEGKIRYRGKDAMAYFTVKWEGNVWWTNPATGKSVHLRANFIQRDQRIVDNDDGTITIRYRGKINETDYNADGSVAFRTQGVDTLILVIDINGTPSNPDDDTLLSEDYLGFTGHDGRDGVDFCAWYTEQTS
jgi:hypothetical protein